MTQLVFDLATTPFSRRGSYLAVSRFDRPDRTGIFLRTVHGDTRIRELLRFIVGGTETPEIRATPGCVTLAAEGAGMAIALDGAGRAMLRVDHGEVALDFQVRSSYDVVLQERPDTWRFTASGASRNYRIVVQDGAAMLNSTWDGIKGTSAQLTITAVSNPVTVIIDEYLMTPPTPTSADFDDVAAEAAGEFEAWSALHGTHHSDPTLAAAGRLAAYVTWSALVPPGGMLQRESMLMSKNGMTHIWSWDHCFNAMALARAPDAAADQLLTLFDHQDAAGALPDHIDDTRIQPNFTKPPIHGWAIGYLMDRGGLTSRTLAEIYAPLARWTDWWFDHRVFGSDGVPSYSHGNDSGWDNSTVFAEGVPVQSPDLLAFLALQMTTLARIADDIGRPGGSEWRERSKEIIALLVSHFWRGDRFVARHTLNGRDIEYESLLTVMPLVLGADLPREVFDALVRRLVEGSYITERGVATEPTTSPYYVPDGYWRGPVWAPTTMLLIDGLRRGGRRDLAGDIALRFITTCAKSGMAENFDALTGQGLRDRSMTWTASVYLALLAEAGRAK